MEETVSMGQLDMDPIPPYAITCWTNDREIFVAMPMTKGGQPFIISFPLNEGGLTKALEVLRKRPKEVILPTLDQPANYTKPPQQPQVRVSKAQEKLYAETTPEQRDAAQSLLKKLGFVK
jgi:hypothetical protein